jgi:dTDP-4-amino-4,6-dideoxygalactose transaminase
MIPIVQPFIPPREVLLPALENVLYSGYIAEGEQVREFEREIAKYVENSRVLSVNSGTSALHLALLLAGVKEGDEVISTVLTAEPTNVAIKQTGAKVVWADIDYSTGILSAQSVREKITTKTKAIMVVHYAGVVADMDAFGSLSAETGIPIIEDAAHALGARYNGKSIGAISPYTVFSFQAIKHMTTVDGGLLALKSEEDYTSGRLKRWFGLDKTRTRLENDITEVGYKYHMNNVNAIIGIVQMKYLRNNIDRHISNGKYFDAELQGIPGVELLKYYDRSEPSYWLYTLKVENRAAFIKKMEAGGITASELHQRNDRHSLFRESKTDLPILDAFYQKMVHIPCGWWVGEVERAYISEVIKQGW